MKMNNHHILFKNIFLMNLFSNLDAPVHSNFQFISFITCFFICSFVPILTNETVGSVLL